MSGKLIILSAPSGSGKSTIIRYLLTKIPNLEFSISATSRAPRGKEQNGVEYYFLSADEFRQHIKNNDLIEYEEVYPGCFYGTLHSEIDRISAKGNHIIFDVDVLGGLNIKKQFGKRALALFIAPPDIETLHERLTRRGTESPEMIVERIKKADYELKYATLFDKIIVNDILEKARTEALNEISKFLSDEVMD